jgi:F-type H+-transporting ATPase subunit delta
VTNRTAASRYARALLDVAVKEKGNLEQIDGDLASFVELFTQNPLLEKVLLNPAVPVQRKRATVVELTARAGASPTVSKLLVLLAERDRLVLLRDVLDGYRERLLDYQQVVRAHITTASPLDADRTRAIERGLASVTGKTVTLETSVDPSIIGGVVARIGSTVYDGSITRQLERMRQKLVEGV